MKENNVLKQQKFYGLLQINKLSQVISDNVHTDGNWMQETDDWVE